MLTYASTLPAGPYDWHDAVLPRTEFDARIAAVRDVMAKSGVSTLAIYGSTYEHGALAYLTNFIPKLGFAIAFLPARGDVRITYSLGANMQPAFRRLTWVETVEPAGNFAAQIAKQFAAVAASPDGFALGLWGTAGMASRVYRDIQDAAVALGSVTDLDPALHHLLRKKSVCEKGLLQRSAAVLRSVFDHIRSGIGAGAGRRSLAVAAERHAYRLGAQDVRILLSARPGGPPRYLDDSVDPCIDPLNAYVAVRCRGYWAEGQSSLASAVRPLHKKARAALAACLDALRPGAAAAALVQKIDCALSPYRRDCAINTIFAGYTGLSLDEALMNNGSALSQGEFCLVRIAAIDDANGLALASALVEVGGGAAGTPLVYFIDD